jgi:Ser/Thr protein kinase RdoA (MazF antagonist)
MTVATRAYADAEATRLEPQVRALLARAGVRATAAGIAAVPGGRNNRIYKIRAGADHFALKWYHRDPADPRDRFAAETEFLEVVAARGVSDSPQLLATDADDGLALLEWIDGTSVAQATSSHVDAALVFIERINAPGIRSIALRRLSPASQTAGTIAEHAIGLVQRVAALRGRWSCPPHWRDAAALTIDRLERCLQARLGAIDAAPHHPLTDAQRVVSPSDFGFHNAIDRGSGVAFIDFEYAGWDDPAKLVCDFFLQPRVPVSRTHLTGFTAGLASACRLEPDWLAQRVALLMPICRLLWACIALNVLDPVHLRRRLAATGHGDMDDLLSVQLALANFFMDEPDRT